MSLPVHLDKKEYMRVWRAKNAEHRQAYAKDYSSRPEVKEKTQLRSKRIRADSPELAAFYWTKWEANNPEKMEAMREARNAKRREMRRLNPNPRPTPRLSASLRGFTTYYSDRLCKYGHDAPRYTNCGRCTECCRSVWYPKNSGKHLHLIAIRRARQAQAMPSWLTQEHKKKIKSFYLRASNIRQKFKGMCMTVDHVIPINHPLICGLHVPWNLQLLSKSKNSIKSNKLEPEIHEFA